MSRRPPELRTVSTAPGGLPRAASRDVRTAPTFSLAELPACKGGGGMSRRDFCLLAGSSLVGLGLAACDPGAPRITVGDGVEGANGTSNGPPVDGAPDLATPAGHDGGVTNPDLAMPSGTHDMAQPPVSCGSAAFNAGPSSAVAMGAAKYLTDNSTYELFLCRDAGGLYALTASCPHEGRTITKQTSRFYCPSHGATFDLNGDHPTWPAFAPLEHYAICVDASGDVLIDPNKVVASTTRA